MPILILAAARLSSHVCPPPPCRSSGRDQFTPRTPPAEYQNRLPAGGGMQLALEIPLLWRDYRVESSSLFVSGQNLLPAVTADSQPAGSRDLPMYRSGLRLPGYTILLILACFRCAQCMCLHLAPDKHCLAMVLASQKSSFKKFGLNLHKCCSGYLPTSEPPGMVQLRGALCSLFVVHPAQGSPWW